MKRPSLFDCSNILLLSTYTVVRCLVSLQYLKKLQLRSNVKSMHSYCCSLYSCTCQVWRHLVSALDKLECFRFLKVCYKVAYSVLIELVAIFQQNCSDVWILLQQLFFAIYSLHVLAIDLKSMVLALARFEPLKFGLRFDCSTTALPPLALLQEQARRSLPTSDRNHL
jgi:hypothetical protein